MNESESIPVGRLQSVTMDWDFRGGWVRAPLREIVFNSRLTKQARLVWLWLASAPASNRHVSWGECEVMLNCGTKARRNCISQLVTEGYVTINEDGSVILHDPYEVYSNKRKEILEDIRDEWREEVEILDEIPSIEGAFQAISAEKSIDRMIDKELVRIPKTPSAHKNTSQQTSKPPNKIIEAWNKYSPSNYSKIRTLSNKQQECINKHMRNLGVPKERVEEFISAVCQGLKKNEFWSKKVSQSARNFNSVFGYGSPQDTKMRNIEDLYGQGATEVATEEPKEKPREYNSDEEEMIGAYRFIRMNLESSKSRGEEKEINRWQGLMEDNIERLAAMNISHEDI
jgi:hypothetical protein